MNMANLTTERITDQPWQQKIFPKPEISRLPRFGSEFKRASSSPQPTRPGQDPPKPAPTSGPFTRESEPEKPANGQ